MVLIRLTDWLTRFLHHHFLTFRGSSLRLFLHIPVLYFLDGYQDILRGWGWVKGKMWSQWFHWTWYNSWGPSVAYGQLRLPDSRWSGILTQFLDVSLMKTNLHLTKSSIWILDSSSRMWMSALFFFKSLMCWFWFNQTGLTKGFHLELHIQSNLTICHQKQFIKLWF